MVNSVLNRSPPELLKEILLVNDSSTVAELANLKEHVANTSQKVKLLEFSEKRGLIACRMEAARLAIGDILIFLDPLTEVMTNWMPPLINPIKDLRSIATLPRIDKISKDTFGMNFISPYRGLIDWHMDFIHTYTFYFVNEFTMYDVPIMLGSAFAINREYFFEIGGYDELMTMEGGENIDLSFKLWHCGDGIYEIPCAKIAQIFEMRNPPKTEHVYRNYKRIAEIWLDNHKEYFYARDPERYAKIDAGDITKQLEARKRCVPFNYFLEFIAPEFTLRYPLKTNYPRFASGTIKSIGMPQLCLDSQDNKINLATCDQNATNPKNISQNFVYSYHKNIFLNHVDFCLDAEKIGVFECVYYGYASQTWNYSITDMQLKSGKDSGKFCLAAHTNKTISMAVCNNTDQFQKWEFGLVDPISFNKFNSINGYGLDLLELNYEETFKSIS